MARASSTPVTANRTSRKIFRRRSNMRNDFAIASTQAQFAAGALKCEESFEALEHAEHERCEDRRVQRGHEKAPHVHGGTVNQPLDEDDERRQESAHQREGEM